MENHNKGEAETVKSGKPLFVWNLKEKKIEIDKFTQIRIFQ